MVTGSAAGNTAVAIVDPGHGGRWTSLRIGGREWLWSRDEPRRAHVAPGDPFADAGGIEECVPTVRGRPDHGAVWSRTWHAVGSSPGTSTAEVRCDDFALRRVIAAGDGRVSARYRLAAAAGYRFVWAAHALLDVSAAATLHVHGTPDVRLYAEAAGLTGRPWPPGAPFITARWPGPGGLRLDRLGPDDGSAIGAIVRDRAEVLIRDGSASLRMSLNDTAGSPAPPTTAPGQAPVPGTVPVPATVPAPLPTLPASVALWRNLGGFPAGRPYRSIGVEPMLGAVFDLAEARQPGDAVTVPPAGFVEWELVIEEVPVENPTTGAAT